MSSDIRQYVRCWLCGRSSMEKPLHYRTDVGDYECEDCTRTLDDAKPTPTPHQEPQ